MLLFLALLLPACIFLFLKFFGRNEFSVPALYVTEYPEGLSECGQPVALPYRIPDSVRNEISVSKATFTLIYFDSLSREAENNLDKIKERYRDGIVYKVLGDTASKLRKCVFFLRNPYDLALIDSEGAIRGQYASSERDELDRLRMELSILFKEY